MKTVVIGGNRLIGKDIAARLRQEAEGVPLPLKGAAS